MKKKQYNTKNPSSAHWFIINDINVEIKNSSLFNNHHSLILYHSKYGAKSFWLINTHLEIKLTKGADYLISFELMEKSDIKLSSIKTAFINYWHMNKVGLCQDVCLTKIDNRIQVKIRSQFSNIVYFGILFNWDKEISQNIFCSIKNFSINSSSLDYRIINDFNKILNNIKKIKMKVHDFSMDGDDVDLSDLTDWKLINKWNDHDTDNFLKTEDRGIIISNKKWGNNELWIVNKSMKFSFISGMQYCITGSFTDDTNNPIKEISFAQILDIQLNDFFISDSINYNFHKRDLKLFFKSKFTGEFYIGFRFVFKGSVGEKTKYRIENFRIKMIKFNFSYFKNNFFYQLSHAGKKQEEPVLTEETAKKMPMYCSAPFVYLVVRPWGEYTYCCRIPSINSLKQYKTLNDTLFSPDLELIRYNIVNNHFINDCSQCYNEEALGQKSIRQEINNNYKYAVNVELKLLEIAFSNICNLSCLTCGSYNSTKWIEYDKLLGVNSFKQIINDIDYKKIDFSKLEVIKFLGGEPFIEKRNFEFLEYLDEIDILKNIHIWFITNCTVFPDLKILKLMSKAHKTSFTLSIDGIGSVNDYIRCGSKWDIIEKNMNKWYSCGLDNMIFIKIETVLSIYNLFYAEEIDNYFTGKDHFIDILYNPDFLSITILREEVKNKIKDIKETGIMSSLAKNSIFSQKPNKELFTKFIAFTQRMDEIRKVKFADMCPKTYNAIFPE